MRRMACLLFLALLLHGIPAHSADPDKISLTISGVPNWDFFPRYEHQRISVPRLPTRWNDGAMQLSDIKESPELIHQQRERLHRIILPDVNISHVGLREALAEVRVLSVAADSHPNPQHRGVNIFIEKDTGDISGIEISLSMQASTLAEVLLEVAKQSGTEMVVRPYWVSLVPKPKMVQPTPAIDLLRSKKR